MSGWLPNLLQAAQPGEFSLGEGSSLYVQWGAVLGASLAAAVWDLRQRRIPNALTFPLLGSGIVYSAWVGGLSGAAGSLGGCLLAALPFVVLFVYAGGGAGDAKLMGAIGAWLGVTQSLVVLVAVVSIGAVLGLAQAAWHKRLSDVTGRMGTIVRSWYVWFVSGHRTTAWQFTDVQQLQMPYAVSIFSGVTIAALGILLWHA
jgi:prepilin peptidase CpaA